jgi:hypothetical protein
LAETSDRDIVSLKDKLHVSVRAVKRPRRHASELLARFSRLTVTRSANIVPLLNKAGRRLHRNNVGRDDKESGILKPTTLCHHDK